MQKLILANGETIGLAGAAYKPSEFLQGEVRSVLTLTIDDARTEEALKEMLTPENLETIVISDTDAGGDEHPTTYQYYTVLDSFGQKRFVTNSGAIDEAPATEDRLTCVLGQLSRTGYLEREVDHLKQEVDRLQKLVEGEV